MKNKRREVTVKHNPGISKLQEWNTKAAKWVDQQKFRSTRRIVVDGVPRRESGVFDNIEDAKQFRLGKRKKAETGTHHKSSPVIDDSRMRFSTLLAEWKDFHYLTVDFSTK